MLCTQPKVKGGSGLQNLCGGEIKMIQHSRPGSRELHTDFVCIKCHHKWSAEDFALLFAEPLQQILAVLRGGNADRVVESGETTMRLLRERKSPLQTALSEEPGDGDYVTH